MTDTANSKPNFLCPHCKSSNTVKNGFHSSTRTQKITCRDCGRNFRTRYRNKAHRPGTTRNIDRLTDQGVSVRNIAAHLGIAPTTVQTHRKALATTYREQITTPYPIPPNVTHVISWSGGKDSSALVVWALANLPFDRTRFVFCDTGWESPITYRFLEDVNQRLLHGKLIVLRSRRYRSLLDLAAQKSRFPSPKARFCTEELKIVPMVEWLLEQKEDLAIYQGIRAEESFSRGRLRQSDEFFRPQIEYDHNPYFPGTRERRRTPLFQRQVMTWLEKYDCTVERPFFYWKKRDVLALCRKHNVLNPLYDLGFERVGCFPCMMENKRGIRMLAQHDPQRIDLIENAERQLGRSFFPFNKVSAHFGEKPTIRDVVKWAQSSNPDQPELAASCLSHYVQCEGN